MMAKVPSYHLYVAGNPSLQSADLVYNIDLRIFPQLKQSCSIYLRISTVDKSQEGQHGTKLR